MTLLRKSPKIIPLVIMSCFIGFLISYIKLGILFNFTASLPYGFYIKSISSIKEGDYIAFCLDKKNQELGLARKYLEPGSLCNGSSPLLKKVIALPMQQVILANDFIQIGDKKLPYKTLQYDSYNRVLFSYPKGAYKSNCYWLVGDNDTLHSWDSRYYGCINATQILYKIKPLLTWK